MEKKRSLGVNFIFNMMRTMMGVIIPLITFPYSSRVLGPVALGKVDYAQANMTYFTLLQAFGIGGYAIREGARIRDDRKKMDEFASDMLSINLITSAIAYILFFAALAIPKLAGYRTLMLLFSTTIILSTIGVEWLYNIYEEYQYITIRSFFFQIVSVVMLFTCVKSENDYMIYALTMVISSVGSNIMNFIRARKYVTFRFHISRGLWQHIKPMSYIFLLDVASSVYLVMDRSMLGYITGDDGEVGLYAAAIKIASVLTSFFGALNAVIRPRVAYMMERDEKQAEQLNDLTARLILLFNIPMAIGMFCLSRQVLHLFAGSKYLDVTTTMQVLMLNVIVATFNGFLINQLFIVHRKDKWASTGVVIGAVTNICLNAITIPLMGKFGAAISTVIAECAIFIYASIKAREMYPVTKLGKQVIQSVIACVPIVGIFELCSAKQFSDLLTVALTVAGGAIGYFVIMLLFRNQLVLDGIEKIRERFSRTSI